MESTLTKREIIEGILTSEDQISIKSVDIVFRGSTFMNPDVVDNKFQIEITERFENGKYDVIWNVTINGVDKTVNDSFVVSNDLIDPSLPRDLQTLA